MEQYTPPPTKIPCGSSKEYDVFLSFRGKDVRDTLAHHLYEALTAAGLHVFLDTHKLKKEEIVGLSLERAVDSSALRIPIFSSGYADSAWCLREAACMLRTPGLIIPLFYLVDPTDVRYPLNNSSPYMKSFEKHYAHDRYSSEQIEEWKNALLQICSRSGWSMDTSGGSEAHLIKTVVIDVIKTFERARLEVAKHPVGLEGVTEDLIHKFQLISGEGVIKAGLLGIGGIGKTTLAKAVYNQVSSKFDAASFIFNVRTAAAESTGLTKLQKKILKDVCAYGGEVDSVEKGKSLFKERLSGVRVLLILDDVDEMKQSHALVRDWLALGSRVIITSRDKHILHHAGVSSDEFIHEMSGLQMNEGLQLFSWHAFLRSSPFPSHKHLSERIVEACKGHPLSLEVIGSFLYDKQNDSDCWTEALHNITHHPDIRERFKISYNALSEEEKEIFLDIACFFVGENKTYPIVFWKSLYRTVHTAISTLSLKLLIKIDDDGVFDMHDHLQDMGRSIAEREREGSRLWDSAHLSGGVSNDNNLSRLRLNGGNSQGLETLYAPALQFLHLEDVPIAGITRAMLPPSLIWLRLQNCGKPFHTSLHVRNIWLSAIQWPSCFSFVDNIWYLRVLQIDGDIPNLQCSLSKILGNLSQLQHLDLRNCSKLNKLPRTIGKLSNLQRLDLSNCQKLKKLPHTIGRLSNLQSLKLQCCDKLNELPHTIGNLSQLHHLDLMRCNLNNLPDTLCNLSKLQQLCLKEFKNLNLPHTIDNLVQLQHLKLFLCGNLNSLPNTIGNLSQLQHLCLKSCINLNNLPHTIGNLLQLQHLNLEECVSLNNLPDTICNLTQLQGLYLRGCKNLNKLPHNIGSLVNLQRLNLTWCVNLKDLPNTLGNLVQLQQLNLRECEHLKNLPDTIGSLLNLQKFDLTWCVQLNELPCTVGNLSQLQYLNLEGCRNLNNLPDTIGKLSQLQYFNLRGCRNLNSLPDTIGNLSQLQQLNLKGCRNLSKLPDTIKNLSQLQHLNLK